MDLAPWLVETAVKGTALVAAAGLADLFLQRRPAAQRHLVWATAIACLALLAPLSLWFPARPVRLPERFAPVLSAVSSPPASAARPPALAAPRAEPVTLEYLVPPSTADGPRLGGWIVRVWAVGAAAVLLFLLASWARLRLVHRGHRRCEDPRIVRLASEACARVGVPERRVALRQGERILSPMTWGVLRPALILPADCGSWEEERLWQALIHELAHVRRRDTATQALSNAACVLFWFHPLVWWAARRMIAERECACDDVVLRNGAKASSYASELLGIARTLRGNWTGARVAPAMVRRSQVGMRLLAVLDSGQRRNGLRLASGLAVAALGLGSTVGVASVSFAQPRVAEGCGCGEEARFSISRARPVSTVELRVTGDWQQRWEARERIRRYLEESGVQSIGYSFTEYYDGPDVPAELSRAQVGWFVPVGAIRAPAPFIQRELKGSAIAWVDAGVGDDRAWGPLLRFTLMQGYMTSGPGVNIDLRDCRTRVAVYAYKMR